MKGIHHCRASRSACRHWQPDAVALQTRDAIQKMLNRRINSWRASIACAGFMRLSTFSRRSRSIAASSRTSRLRAFHFAYLPAPMPSASSAETTQTVMSVEVTRSISVEHRSRNVPPSQQSSSGTRGARAPRPPFSAPRRKASQKCPARRVTQRARRPRSPAFHRAPVS